MQRATATGMGIVADALHPVSVIALGDNFYFGIHLKFTYNP
jgi:hypothetical protein